jgi:D-serine deaminase-like pyridoxal phosphate-dependent protein
VTRRPGGSDRVDELAARHRLASRLSVAVAGLDPRPSTPTYVVDLDAFDANAADLARRAAGTPIRVATKSLRVPALVARALDAPGFHGVLAYALREALWLHAQGISDDLVLGYPTVDRSALARLTGDVEAAAAITLMVDDPAQLDAVAAARASEVTVRVALDVDAGLRIGSAHVGPKRSPLHDVGQVLDMARTVVDRPGFALVGAMTYEGQVAGVPDDVPDQRARSVVVRRIKQASVAQLAHRRAEVVAALRDLADLEIFNAGGSGSIESSAGDPAVTEVTAGSGLLVPGLFDHYRSFAPRPAAYFALPVVRRPAEDCVTVAGGGLIASGPTGKDRSPQPWAPPGLHLTGLEGAGEVQTPLVGPGASALRIGDLVWFRHAKSGEVAEHVLHAHLVRGGEVVDVVPTYRGTGNAW